METTGLFSIAAFGAAGGGNPQANGGAGASASGQVNLTAGTVLDILVSGTDGRSSRSNFGGGGRGGG